MLEDGTGRKIGYLRLSLTKACQMRCAYCRPAVLGHQPDETQLSPQELEDLVRHLAVHQGLRKVRITGGDPTARPDLVRIIERLAGIDELTDLAMTTNGLTLARRAEEYAKAGLRRVNVSLDTLDREQFRSITGVDGVERVVEGIDAAIAAGLTPVKLNTVVMKGVNDGQLAGLVQFAADRRVMIRFIELMPMGPLAERWAERYCPESEMRQALGGVIEKYEALPRRGESAQAYRVTLQNGQNAKVGFITPMSCPFCSACDRIRIAADGALFPCLMDRPAGSLLAALRPRLNAEDLNRRLGEALAHKAPEHPATGFVVMTHIGG
jgi:cyclic pyranopterin phosphate synthase